VTTDDDVHLSILTVTCTALRWTASTGLNIWFWFRGLDIPNPLQCKEPRVYLFANLGAYGPVRTAFKVFSIFGAVYSFFLILILSEEIIRRAFFKKGTFEERFEIKCLQGSSETKPVAASGDASESTVESTIDRERRAGTENEALTNPEDRQQTNTQKAPKARKDLGLLIIVPVITLALTLTPAVIGIELQIRWNNLTGLNNLTAVGQIVPLTIGCFSLLRTIFLLIVETGVWDRKKDSRTTNK
jgi:hypothetical protein